MTSNCTQKKEPKLRIGLFGGTFDPWTKAHQAIVDEVLKQNLVDFVVILPTIVDYHRKGKTKWLSDTEKFTAIYSFISKSPYQDKVMMDFQEVRMRNSGRISKQDALEWRFINTVERCERLFVGSDLYVIIGTDSLANFKTWHRWEDISSKCKIIAIQGRNGNVVKTDMEYIPVSIPEEFSYISSSDIRKKYDNVYEYLSKELENGKKK